MEKVIFVQAHFRPLYKEVTIEVPTGEKKKGLFGGEKDVTTKEKKNQATGELSDSEIDGVRLAEDCQKTIDSLNNEGYSVISITPVESGAYTYQAQEVASSTEVTTVGGGIGKGKVTEKISGGVSYGYGYSYTEGLIVVASKPDL